MICDPITYRAYRRVISKDLLFLTLATTRVSYKMTKIDGYSSKEEKRSSATGLLYVFCSWY